jgi:hypothetical protein
MALPKTVETREFDKFQEVPSGTAVRVTDASGGSVALYDFASSSVIYIGEAAPGSLPSQAVWKISRISLSGTSAEVRLAGGTALFDKIWDNRSGLAYS